MATRNPKATHRLDGAKALKILLMVQKSQTTTWDVYNLVNNGINMDKLPTSTGEFAGFLPPPTNSSPTLRSGDVTRAQEILMDMTSRRFLAFCIFFFGFDKEELIGKKVGKFGTGG